MKGFIEKTYRLQTFINLIIILISVIFLGSCTRNGQENISHYLAENIKHKDLSLHKIRDRGTLVAATPRNGSDYFIYHGEPMGFQYENLKIFADHLGLKLEIKVIDDIDEAFRALNDGECDLITMGLTVTNERTKKADFTDPIIQTREMLVQRKPDNWRKMSRMEEIEQTLIRNTLMLSGKTIYVQDGSVYYERLKNLSDEIGGTINTIEDPARQVEQLVEAVNKGLINYTICDEYLAYLYEKNFPEVDIKTPVSLFQNLAWAVKQGSDSLRIAVNTWLGEFNKTLTSKFLFEQYFESPRSIQVARGTVFSGRDRSISKYDDIIREVSMKYDIDWRLLASIIYQESQFRPEVKSAKGAFGLMQLMPRTALLLGVDSTSSMADQLEAGVRYLHTLDGELPKEIKNPDERLKFILASYNVGIAHVFDARRLAGKNGRDPNVWTGNVDYFVLNKSNPEFYQDTVVRYGYAHGEETFQFVQEVLNRYERYKNTVEN